MTSVPRQAVTLLSGKGVIRLAQLATFILLARFLSPAEFGWFGILTTTFVLAATLGSLGFRQSLAYEVGQHRLRVGEANGVALAIWLPLTIATSSVIVWLYASEVPSLSYINAAALIVVGVAAAMFLMLIQGTFLGSGQIGAFTASESIPRVVLLLGVIVLGWTGSVTLSAALWAHVGGFALVAPIGLWLASRKAGKLAVRFDNFVPMLRYGFFFAVNLFFITLCSRLAMYIIEREIGASAAGQFFAAARIYEILLEVAGALGMVLFSDIARSRSKTSRVHRNARVACWTFWSFVLLAMALTATASISVDLLLGQGYARAVIILQILCIGLPPAAANKVIYPTFAGAGKPQLGTPVILIGLVINAALAFALVPAWGAAGGAVAVSASQFVIFAGYLVLCVRKFDVPVRLLLLPLTSDVRALITSPRRILGRNL